MYTQNSHSLDTLTTFFSLCASLTSVVFSCLVSRPMPFITKKSCIRHHPWKNAIIIKHPPPQDKRTGHCHSVHRPRTAQENRHERTICQRWKVTRVQHGNEPTHYHKRANWWFARESLTYYTPEGHQPRIQSISDYTGQCNTICYQMSVISRAQECHWQSTFQGIRMQFLLSLPWMQIIIEMLQLSSDMTRLLSPGAVYSHSFVRIPPLSSWAIHPTMLPFVQVLWFV